jgi:hypothetical protein
MFSLLTLWRAALQAAIAKLAERQQEQYQTLAGLHAGLEQIIATVQQLSAWR